MTQLPNIITLLRIAGSWGLLLCDVTGVAIWIVYALCGISDMVDGWLARKLKCVTKTGALLDSLADICFVACCAWKFLPTGFLLFIAVPMTFWSIIPITIVAAIATFAAIQEGHFIKRNTTRQTGRWLTKA